MKKYIFLICVLCLGTWLYFQNTIYSHRGDDTKTQNKIESVAKPQYQVSKYTVADGDVFSKVMQNLGLSYSDSMSLLDAVSSTYDFKKIKVGQPFSLYKNDAGQKVKLEYEKDSEEMVEVNFVDAGYEAKIIPITYDIQTDFIAGVVDASLWIDGQKAGMSDDLIIKFANVFDWTVDFGIAVQKGDQFSLLYEKRFRDGKLVGSGNILAGKFVNSGKEYWAYGFEDAQGNLSYYNEKAESLKKQFLRAPLEYRYISSGFTGSRVDPIHGRTTGHHALDYAAAQGTPVRAVGNGVIEFLGWNAQGFGNFISIHHNATYVTQYGHLSGFAKGLKKGSQVVQGQVIGYVGSTGHSTGPHLHYQIKKNGQLVNPLTIELPSGDSISAEKRDAFEERKTKLNAMFHSE